jgi:hypothetical protein
MGYRVAEFNGSEIQYAFNILNGENKERLSEMEKFCEHVNAEVIQNNSILKKLDEERIAHSETRAYLKTVKEQPCNDADQHSLEISKIESEMTVVCEANLFLDSQVEIESKQR